MEEKKVKSEFLAKSEAFGKEMSDLINPEKKDRKAIIVIAVETDENDDTTCAVSLSGSGFELVNGIMSFIKNNKELVRKAAHLGMLEALSKKL